jgi:hypothetical protein
MRGFRSALGVGAVVLAYGGLASATTINVNTTNCSFDQAVQAVNNRAAVGGCPAGNGNADKINIPAGTFNISPTVPVEIRRTVQIVGASQASTILQTSRNENQDASGDELFTVVTDAALAPGQTVTISNLTLKGGTGNRVGGIANTGSTGPAINVTISGVRVTGFQIAPIFNAVGTLNVTNSLVNNNDVSLDSGGTSGIENTATLHVTGTTIDSNNGNFGGGFLNTGTATIYASTISNNGEEGFGGGGIFNSGTLSIGHSTITGNFTSGNGGGIDTTAGSSLYLGFSTVTNNGGSPGGGVFIDPAASALLNNNIVANNTDTDSLGTAPDVSGNLGGSASDLIEDPSGFTGGTNIISGLNPVLGPLTTVDTTPATQALLPGSPAIDAGFNDTSHFPDNLDERGFPRPTDGNGDNVVAFDLGAFEFDPWQTERLVVAAKSSDSHSITSDPGYSNGEGTLLQSNAKGDFVTYKAPLPGAGTYTVKLRFRRGNNRGEFQVQTASNLNGTYTNLGAVQDSFRSSADFVTVTLGNFTVASAGTKYFKFLITGKNAASSSFQLTLDYLLFTLN